MKLFSKKLNQNDIDGIVQRKLDWIVTNSNPIKVLLFGSALTGDMTESSDVDLIAIYSNNSDLKSISLKLAKSRPKDDWPQDLIFQTIESFEKNINKGGGACWLANQEGKILFERTNYES